MLRGPVLSAEQDVLERHVSVAKPAADAEIGPSTDPQASPVQTAPAHCKSAVAYEKAESFYGIRFSTPGTEAVREVVRSMLAMWQAAHNTDFYITKYQGKPMESLTPLFQCMTDGVMRLERQEQKEEQEKAEAEAALHSPDAEPAPKQGKT